MATSKREKQAERQDLADSRATERDLEALLYPMKAAEGPLKLAERQQHLESAKTLAESAKTAAIAQKKSVDDQAAQDGAFAAEYNANRGTKLTATEIRGLQAGAAAAKQANQADPIFTADEMLKTTYAKQDAAAMEAGGIDSKTWGAMPDARQSEARFGAQMHALTPQDGTGLHWDELSKLKVGSGTVADALSDPNNFTARGLMTPKVEKDIRRAQEEALRERSEKRLVARAVALTEGQANTAHGKALAAQKKALESRNIEAALVTKWKNVYGSALKHETAEVREEHFKNFVLQHGGTPGSASAADNSGTSAINDLFPTQE